MSSRTVKSQKRSGGISRTKARSVATALRAELKSSPLRKVSVIRTSTTASGSGRISFAWIPKAKTKSARKRTSARRRG